MKKNMGTNDKVFRISTAIIFAILYYTGTIDGLFGLILLIIGVAFVLTSLLSFCPLYLPLGISTCKKK